MSNSRSRISSSALSAIIWENENAMDLTFQPMVHVERMAEAVAFYEALGARLVQGSRDGDWALVQLGESAISLLAHPANPDQHEGRVELNIDSKTPLDEVAWTLRGMGIAIARDAADEAFGSQLQIETPDGLLVKINYLEPELYQ